MAGETKNNDEFIAMAKALLQKHVNKVRKAEIALERKNGVDPTGRLEQGDLFVMVKSFFTAASGSKNENTLSANKILVIKQRVIILDLLTQFNVYEKNNEPHPMNIIEEVQNNYQFYRKSLDITVKRDDFDELLDALHQKAAEHYKMSSGTVNVM